MSFPSTPAPYNYGIDAVPRSTGTVAQSMFAPSQADNVQTAVLSAVRTITVTSGSNYNLTSADAAALFPTPGVYLFSCDSAGTADLAATGRVTFGPGTQNNFYGFQATTSISGAGFATYAQMLCTGGPPSTTITLQQNTGANVVYSATSIKLAN
jgi:hypothetical protein